MLKRYLGEKHRAEDLAAGRDLWYVQADSRQFDQVTVQPDRQCQGRDAGGRHATITHRNVTSARARSSARGIAPGEYVLIEVATPASA